VLVFPAASVAVQVTVVVPGRKKEPDAGEQTVVTVEQLSLAFGGG
jgi:hypothetical protein